MTYKDCKELARLLSDSYGGCLTEREIREYASVYWSEYRYYGGDISKSMILMDVINQIEGW